MLAMPLGASAQMDFSLDEAETEGEAGAEAEGGADMSFGEGEAEGEAGAEGEGDVGGGDFGDGDIIGELASGDDGMGGEMEQRERPTETVEEVFAVQQIYALRLNRLELAPSAAFTINDPFVSHPAVSVALNYWFTNVLALGVNFLWYQWGDPTSRESDLNFFVRRATRLGIPITEWQLGAHLNFTYVPFYGKFSVFREFIFQYDAYVVGGVGMMRTRPVPVIDPEFRSFDFQTRVAFNLGIGLRVFLSRFAGIFFEFRDYAYLERFESLDVAPTSVDRQDEGSWYSDSTTFTNNMTVQVGFTLFFPFTFEYKLPK
ncbi:MAG: outer membrane beta-barrel domain-containing protein [Sandaracinus sp.]|nr:outer membrane beta-barrel domain-containing protein [Sandaracinus sp.]